MALPEFDPDFAAPGDWAAMYRAAGLQVVPSHAPHPTKQWKRPALDWKEFQGALVPDAVFERWYGASGEHARRSNMGMLTGSCSGNAFVLDLDVYKSKKAREWWDGVLWRHNGGRELDTVRQTTGGGGKQLVFRARLDWPAPTNKTTIDVDVRGQGGFAVLPPSRHLSGSAYAWDAERSPWECEIAEAPEWLLEEVDALVRDYGGAEAAAERAQRERPDAPAPNRERDDFGARVDGREAFMAAMVWAAVVNWWRECPMPPTADESRARMKDAYAVYERSVKSRVNSAEPNAVRLEREGRGATLFAEKWRRAVEKWDGDVARDAMDGAWKAAEPEPAEDDGFGPSAAQPQPERFRFEKVGDLRALPAVKWLVDRWIPEGTSGIFYGKWAAGKSFVGFDLCLHLAYGMLDWHGAKLPGEPVDVLILAREGHNGFIGRIDAFKAHHGIVDDPDRLTFMRASVSFMRDDEFAALCESVRARGERYRLVLVDTVARVMPGADMNEQGTVTLFTERCQILAEITGAAAIGVHHQNKSGGMMGSTYFEANSEFVFEVTRTGDEDMPLSRGEITCTKQKDGEDRWKRFVSYEKVALSQIDGERGSLVVGGIGETEAGGTASKRNGGAAGFQWPDATVCNGILRTIGECWDSGYPLSMAAQAKGEGRYAPAWLSRRFAVTSGEVATMVNLWLEGRRLRVDTVDMKTKMKGLKWDRTTV